MSQDSPGDHVQRCGGEAPAKERERGGYVAQEGARNGWLSNLRRGGHARTNGHADGSAQYIGRGRATDRASHLWERASL